MCIRDSPYGAYDAGIEWTICGIPWGQVRQLFNWVRWLNYCHYGLQLSYVKAPEAAKVAMAFLHIGVRNW